MNAFYQTIWTHNAAEMSYFASASSEEVCHLSRGCCSSGAFVRRSPCFIEMDHIAASFEQVIHLGKQLGNTSPAACAKQRKATAFLLADLVRPYLSCEHAQTSIQHDAEPVSAKELERLLNANHQHVQRATFSSQMTTSSVAKSKTDVYVMALFGYAISTMVQSFELDARQQESNTTISDDVMYRCSLCAPPGRLGGPGSSPSTSLEAVVCVDLHIRHSSNNPFTHGFVRCVPHTEANGLHDGRYALHFDVPTHVCVELFTVTGPGHEDTASESILLASSTRALGQEKDIQVSLSASVPRGSARVFSRVSFVRVRSVSGEGHTLNVTVPAPVQQARDDISPDAPVTVHVLFGDTHMQGLKSVVSPSHSFAMSGPVGTAAPYLRVGTSSTAYVGFPVGARLKHEAVLLLEPSNVLCTWNGLLSSRDSEAHSSRIPIGLQQWLNLTDRPTLTHIPSSLVTPLVAPGVTRPSLAHENGQVVPSIDTSKLPQHIAIVMDGNGRWAKQRGLGRSEGHRAGVQAIHAVIRACRRLRIGYLTLYAFSAQNWSRPPAEVAILMSLLDEFVRTDLHELVDNGVRLLVQGDIERLPGSARMGLKHMMEASKHNTGLTLILALSYGGREEIANAASAAASAVLEGKVSVGALADPQVFNGYMQLGSAVPDPDLLIRTSGELRISNFLLWQVAYTELFVTPVLWPDFGDDQLACALAEYARRERRFGKTSEQIAAAQPQAVSSGLTSNTKPLVVATGKLRLPSGPVTPYLLYFKWWWQGLALSARAIILAVAVALLAVLSMQVARADITYSRNMGVRAMRLPLRWLIRGLPLSNRLPSSAAAHAVHTVPSWTNHDSLAQVPVKQDDRHREACLLWLDYPTPAASPFANVSAVARGMSGGSMGDASTVSLLAHTMGHTSCNFSGWTRAGAVADRWETTHPGQYAGAPPLTPRPLASVAPPSTSGMAPGLHPVGSPTGGRITSHASHGRPHAWADIPDHMATMTPYSLPTLPGQLGPARHAASVHDLMGPGPETRTPPSGPLQEGELLELSPRLDDL